MEDVYYNPSDPGSFGGIKRLEERYKKKERRKEIAYFSRHVHLTQTKPVRKSFPRRRVLVHGIDDQWQIDLSSLSRVNDDNNFFSHLSTMTMFILTIKTSLEVYKRYIYVQI